MGSKHWKDSAILSPNSLEKLTKFTDLILLWNSRINLTGYRSQKHVEELLIGESVLAAEVLKNIELITEKASILDFGSGAGIPGLVWAALDLPVEISSLEIRQKKVSFQKEAVRELGLKAKIMLGRFPEAVANQNFDLIVSRAIRYEPGIWVAGEQYLTPFGKFVRFAAADAKEVGWTTIPVSERTSLLVKHKN
jgi:16S rRNA (guanine527-N7)-methyltransferase